MEKVITRNIVIITLAFFSIQCGINAPCRNETNLEVNSPDSTYVASVSERDCGATTDFSTIVSIRKTGIQIVGDEGIIFLVKGESKIRLSWITDRKLQIDCPDCSTNHTFRKEKNWNDVQIIY